MCVCQLVSVSWMSVQVCFLYLRRWAFSVDSCPLGVVRTRGTWWADTLCTTGCGPGRCSQVFWGNSRDPGRFPSEFWRGHGSSTELENLYALLAIWFSDLVLSVSVEANTSQFCVSLSTVWPLDGCHGLFSVCLTVCQSLSLQPFLKISILLASFWCGAFDWQLLESRPWGSGGSFRPSRELNKALLHL